MGPQRKGSKIQLVAKPQDTSSLVFLVAVDLLGLWRSSSAWCQRINKRPPSRRLPSTRGCDVTLGANQIRIGFSEAGPVLRYFTWARQQASSVPARCAFFR